VAVLAASPLRQYLFFGTRKASKTGHICQLHVGCFAVKGVAFGSKVRHICQSSPSHLSVKRVSRSCCSSQLQQSVAAVCCSCCTSHIAGHICQRFTLGGEAIRKVLTLLALLAQKYKLLTYSMLSSHPEICFCRRLRSVSVCTFLPVKQVK
jgi:hypothetical protein